MIECRGRNGWFELANLQALCHRDGTTSISISSKRAYSDMPPIYLAGPKSEIIDLLNQIRESLAKNEA